MLRVLLVSFLGAVLASGCGTSAAPAGSPAAPPSPVRPAASASATTSARPTVAPSSSVGTTLREVLAAAEKTVSAGTIRFDFEATFEGSALIPASARMAGNGQASFGKTRRARMAMDLTPFGMGEFVVVVNDRKIYMKGEAFEPLTGRGKWLLVDLDSKDPSAARFKELMSGQNDTSLAVLYLHGATGEPRDLGVETIDGVVSSHVRLSVDLEEALKRVPESAYDALSDNIDELDAKGVSLKLDADVWVGDDGLIRRTVYEYGLSQRVGGGHMVASFDFSDFGKPLALGIPDKAHVITLETALRQRR